MAQLLPTSGFNSIHVHSTCSIKRRSSFSIHFLLPTLHSKKPQSFLHNNRSFRRFPTRAFDTESNEKLSDEYEKIGGGGEVELVDDNDNGSSSSSVDDKYPRGEFVYREYDPWESLVVKFKMLVALPWERVKKGSVLTMKIRGELLEVLNCADSSFDFSPILLRKSISFLHSLRKEDKSLTSMLILECPRSDEYVLISYLQL